MAIGRITIALVAGAGLVCLFAHSERAWAIDRIDSPAVEKGVFELEYSGNRTSDPHRDKNDIQEHELTVTYAPLDYWSTELTGHFSKEPSDSTQMSGVEWLNTLRFSEPGACWIDSGMEVSYTAATLSRQPDTAEARLLLEKDWGKFTHTANIGLSQDVGKYAEGGPDRLVLWSSRYHYSDHFAPGFEIQSDLGKSSDHLSFQQQEHYAGPALYGSFGEHIDYEAAWLFGVTDAASQNAVRLLLNYHMGF